MTKEVSQKDQETWRCLQYLVGVLTVSAQNDFLGMSFDSLLTRNSSWLGSAGLKRPSLREEVRGNCFNKDLILLPKQLSCWSNY